MSNLEYNLEYNVGWTNYKLIIVQPEKTNIVNCFWLNKLLLKIYKYRLEKMQKTSVKDKRYILWICVSHSKKRLRTTKFEKLSINLTIN